MASELDVEPLSHDEPLTLRIELNVGEDRESTVVRIEKGTVLRFVRGVGALGRRVELRIDGLGVRHVLEETRRLADLDAAFNLRCDHFGAFKYEFTVEDDDDDEDEAATARQAPTGGAGDAQKAPPARGGGGYFSIVPEWRVSPTKTIALNSLAVCTHLTKLLGPLSEWRERLEVVYHAGYNAIHLTPVQQLGVSNSSYSIADFHALNASLGADATLEQLKAFVDSLERDWHMLTIHDVVWNHAARNAPWLRAHPECTHNCANSPHLRPAFIVDQALRVFSDEIADGKWEARGVPAALNAPHHIDVSSAK